MSEQFQPANSPLNSNSKDQPKQEISLLNSAIGPVMRGPSSSHSAAPYMIGRTCRELSLSNAETLNSAIISFDPTGSFSQVYKNQGSDEGFAAGIYGLELTSENYPNILSLVDNDPEFTFRIEIKPLPDNDHPNRVHIQLMVTDTNGQQRTDRYSAISVGGGMFQLSAINEYPISLDGKCPALLIEADLNTDIERLLKHLTSCGLEILNKQHHSHLLQLEISQKPTPESLAFLHSEPGVNHVRWTDTRQLATLSERPLFTTEADLLTALKPGENLAQLACRFEGIRLQTGHNETEALFLQRLEEMQASVARGFAAEQRHMKFLQPSAATFRQAVLPEAMQNNFLQPAFAAALAVMEEGTCRGVVCAAPTAGSAGIIPGCLHGLQNSGITQQQLREALQVMALIGALFAARGSYAAETGGCSVETGTSAAMASAGIVFVFGGSPEQSLCAASLCLMNSLGLVCDPVGGEVEIPCHARNIAGVSLAWSSATAAMSGFKAVLPFDQLVDATVSIGNQMHSDLRCTARGGCATTPAAQDLLQQLIHKS